MRALSIDDTTATGADVPARESSIRQLLSGRFNFYTANLVIMVGSLTADILLPRGATAAIGYCLVPILACAGGNRRILFTLTGVCTALTWLGYILERAGNPPWMSVFERTVVTSILWLTTFFAARQIRVDHELRDVVDELHRSNADLDKFASIVSHDIRGPLTSVALAAQIISERPVVASDAKSNRLIKLIDSEVKRISNLVETLLAYARAGARQVNISECNCETVLARVRQALGAQVENAGAEVTNDPLPVIQADTALMEELFQNLIENALKYQKPTTPPKVHVSAARRDEGWLFSLSDNGIGMDEAECSRVFELLYRGAGAASVTGLGLGLATCRQIVERHGGHITVESEPAQGSTFRIFMPDRSTLDLERKG